MRGARKTQGKLQSARGKLLRVDCHHAEVFTERRIRPHQKQERPAATIGRLNLSTATAKLFDLGRQTVKYAVNQPVGEQQRDTDRCPVLEQQRPAGLQRRDHNW